MQPHYSVTNPAVILSLDKISRMNTTAANIDRALGDIRRYTALTHQKITDLQKEASDITESLVMHWQTLLIDDRYNNNPNTRLMSDFKVYRSMTELRCEMYLLNRNTLVIRNNILRNHLMQLKLEFLNRNNTLVAMHCIISEEIPNRLYSFFQNSAPILYKGIEYVSSHEHGRLAGVALYYDTESIKIVLGRKARTDGDVKEEHIERRLIQKLLPETSIESGYLFVYTTLPPCNTSGTGCLSFYQRLLQANPYLRATVLFDHEYDVPFNYTGLASERFSMVNRVKKARELEQAESRRKSIASMAQNLTRATSDQIVATLQKKDDETLIQIVEQFSDHERKERIKKRLVKKTK
jgi:hypothetical protein